MRGIFMGVDKLNQPIDTNELMSLDDLANGHLDVATLGEAANEDKVITSRLGKQYPSAPMASRLLVENGLIGARPFSTYAKMIAPDVNPPLVDGDYGVVANDPIVEKNGIYQKTNGVWVYIKYNLRNDIDNIKQEIGAINTIPTMQQLYDDLHNPLMSVRIKLVGDSITWGYKASGESAADPRNGRITDPRNTTDAAISPSWANLLSRYLMTAFSDGAITHAASGLAYADSANTVTVSRNANVMSFYSKRLDKKYTSTQVAAQVGVSTTSETGEYFDLSSLTNTNDKPTELSFYTNADTFTLVYAELALSDASDYKVEILIDDVLHETFSPYAATNAFNKRKVVIGQAGRHKITLRNITTNFFGHFRLQGIELARRLSVKNDGIIGSTTKSWLSTVKLSDSIDANDDYVVVQLGTNDRVKSANITLSDTAKNLRTIVSDIYTMTSNNAKVIMMSANAVTQTETNTDVFRFNMRDLNNCIKNVASDLGLPFVSNYEQTLQQKIDGASFLADGLHPNDAGYRMIFDNIKDAITKN